MPAARSKRPASGTARTTVSREVAFYDSLGSRYSYLASTQLQELSAETVCVIDWIPVGNSTSIERAGPNPFRGRRFSGQYD